MDQTFHGKNDDLSAAAKQLTDLVAFGFVLDHQR
jgi:hypothetical protein